MNKQRLIEQRILAQHKIIAERLRADQSKVLALARRNLQRWSRNYPSDKLPSWIGEWAELLNGSAETLVDFIQSESQEALRLRSSSPFAGVLTARERWSLYKEIRDEP